MVYYAGYNAKVTLSWAVQVGLEADSQSGVEFSGHGC